MAKKSLFNQAAATIILGVLLYIVQDDPMDISMTPNAHAVTQRLPKLTPSLVAWISRQAESVIGELEAIAKANANSDQFSVVNYVRYLVLYDHLKIVASKKVKKFNWVSKKVKALSRAHRSAVDILASYLNGLDVSMNRLESAEPLGKSVSVGKDWLLYYQTINYIATHVPKDFHLAKEATEILTRSPSGTPDKRRDIRYKLATQAFH